MKNRFLTKLTIFTSLLLFVSCGDPTIKVRDLLNGNAIINASDSSINSDGGIIEKEKTINETFGFDYIVPPPSSGKYSISVNTNNNNYLKFYCTSDVSLPDVYVNFGCKAIKKKELKEINNLLTKFIAIPTSNTKCISITIFKDFANKLQKYENPYITINIKNDTSSDSFTIYLDFIKVDNYLSTDHLDLKEKFDSYTADKNDYYRTKTTQVKDKENQYNMDIFVDAINYNNDSNKNFYLCLVTPIKGGFTQEVWIDDNKIDTNNPNNGTNYFTFDFYFYNFPNDDEQHTMKIRINKTENNIKKNDTILINYTVHWYTNSVSKVGFTKIQEVNPGTTPQTVKNLSPIENIFYVTNNLNAFLFINNYSFFDIYHEITDIDGNNLGSEKDDLTLNPKLYNGIINTVFPNDLNYLDIYIENNICQQIQNTNKTVSVKVYLQKDGHTIEDVCSTETEKYFTEVTLNFK